MDAGSAKQAEALPVELLAENLLIQAYDLRDSPSWSSLLSVLEAAARVGWYLRERDEAYGWADARLFRPQSAAHGQV